MGVGKGWDRYRLSQIAVEVLAQACLNCPMDVHVFPSIALRVSSCHQENGNFALCHAECEYRGRKIGVGGLNHFEPRITSTSRWRPSSGPLVPRDFSSKIYKTQGTQSCSKTSAPFCRARRIAGSYSVTS